METSAVRLRNTYQIYYVSTNNIFLKKGSLCIVETEHGIDIGRNIKVSKEETAKGIDVKGKILRKLNDEDLGIIPELESIEQKAYNICKEKAKEKKLDMKLISVKCLFDKTKIIFYFVADNRIDFRELVRELAGVFRTRIEMRQIGVRDEARLVGGFGPCGRSHCCSSQREDFVPVSIKMAKEQNLNLNSLKISGMCGRLLCCLSYEYETYCELNKNLPRHGFEIKIGDKSYQVISVDTLRETIMIRYGDSLITVSKYDLDRDGNSYRIKKELIEKILNADEENDDDEEELY